MDISFYCGQCGLHILVPEEGKGMGAVCPSCNAELIVPLESVPKREPPPAAPPAPQASTGPAWAVAGVATVLLIAVSGWLYFAKTKSATLERECDQLQQASTELSKTSVALNQRLAATEQLKTQLQAELDKAGLQLKELDCGAAQLSQAKSTVEQKLTQTEADLEKSRQEFKNAEAVITQLRVEKTDLEKTVAQNAQRQVLAESQLLKLTNQLTELQAEIEAMRAKAVLPPPAPVPPAK